jgi:predicted nucleotidyltransferase
MVTNTLQLPMDDIAAYCERRGIVELALFGSVLRDDFSEDSDIDVLVTFADDVTYSMFQLIPIIDELEALLGREVDFVDRRAVETSANYIRRREVLSTAEVIYAAS